MPCLTRPVTASTGVLEGDSCRAPTLHPTCTSALYEAVSAMDANFGGASLFLAPGLDGPDQTVNGDAHTTLGAQEPPPAAC